MRKVIAAVLILALGAIAGVIGWEYFRIGVGGPRVHVLLPDRDGLERGDPVFWREFEIGRIEEVSLEGDGVRVTARLDPKHAAKLSGETTFKVERRGLITSERKLETYVLNPEAPPLEDGATVEGVGSSLELTLKRAARSAGRLFDRAAESDWLKGGAERVDEFRKELEATDWDALGEDLEKSWEGVARDLEKMAEQTEEEAARAYEDLEPKIEKILKDIEGLGKSKEARRLRERLRAIWGDRPPTEDRDGGGGHGKVPPASQPTKR